MNRQQRRAQDSAVRKAGRVDRRNFGAEAVCAVRGHVLEDVWTLRPPWVGAGIVIPKVHYDRHCSRCGRLDSVWSDLEGEATPQPEAMPLRRWLEVTGAKPVLTPEGEIRYPAIEAIDELVRKAKDA